VALVGGTVYDVATDATGKFVVTPGQDRLLRIYAAASGKHVRCFAADPGHGGQGSGDGGELYKMAVSPGGVFTATCSLDRWIRIVDFYSGRSC
jgi:WD40 repeat protein